MRLHAFILFLISALFDIGAFLYLRAASSSNETYAYFGHFLTYASFVSSLTAVMCIYKVLFSHISFIFPFRSLLRVIFFSAARTCSKWSHGTILKGTSSASNN